MRRSANVRDERRASGSAAELELDVLLVVLLAVGMRRSRSAALAGPSGLLVGGFGLAMVVQGLTPCTPGCAGRGCAPTRVAVATILVWLLATATKLRRGAAAGSQDASS